MSRKFYFPVQKLTINQMLFISHMILVITIICGLSYSRYNSEWERQVHYSALLAKQSINSHINFFSGSVAGVNYANLTMPTTKQTISSFEDILYFEISGVSDYSKRAVNIRYLAETKELWRGDVTLQEIETIEDRIGVLESKLASPSLTNPVTIKKLNYLLNRKKTEYSLLSKSFSLTQTTQIAWEKPHVSALQYQLDTEDCALHIQIPLTNDNGGYIWAVIDASKLSEIQHSLIEELLVEALLALLVSLILIWWVTHWLVSPLKNLAKSMNSEEAYKNINKLPELQRVDEIGQLARAYKGLLTKIESQLNILRTKSDTDPLTGLGSRYKYTHTVSPFLKRHLNKEQYIGMIVCDVDNFKAFNDLYGHTEGDNALAKVGGKIAELARESDLAYRYGGEEFVILCARPTESQLYYFTERLKLEIEGLGIVHTGNLPYRVVTLSIGSAIVSAKDLPCIVTDYRELQERMFNIADKALYSCKELGRNRVQWREAKEDESN